MPAFHKDFRVFPDYKTTNRKWEILRPYEFGVSGEINWNSVSKKLIHFGRRGT